MLRRTRSVLLTAGLLAPALVLGGQSAAGAVDQDLVLSVTSGPAGTEVTASSASCLADPDGDVERYLEVLLISGTSPNDLLVGIGNGYDGDPATFTVPDWVDDTAPAIVEAKCVTYSWYDDAEVAEPYDSVSFDIEPSGGPVTQTRTLSRTELLAGQSLLVSAAGCTGGAYGGVAVFPGDDLSGRTFENVVARGDTKVEGGAFEAEVLFSNGGLMWGAGGMSGGPVVVDELIEIPTDIPAGPYALVAFCGGGEDASLIYEPTVIEITGSAPVGDLDLTSPVDSREFSLAGGSCTDTITAGLSATDLDTLFEDFDDESDSERDEQSRFRNEPGIGRPSSIPGATARRSPDTANRRSRSISAARLLDDDSFSLQDVTPDSDGFWAIDDAVSFDHGIVDGFATCGDPLADGFVYDPQIVEIEVAVEPPPTTTTTTTTTTPPSTPPVAPPPAVAVAAVPTYAG